MRGVGVTVSGLPHEADHAFVVEALDTFLSTGESSPGSEVASFYLAVGDTVELHRVVTETDLETFAYLSGDHSPNHLDQAIMSISAYGGRIAQGALLLAFTSACSTAIVERVADARRTETSVSLGYDRIRFLRPVCIGDRLTLHHVVRAIDPGRRRTRAAFTIHGDGDHLVCVGDHHLKWVA